MLICFAFVFCLHYIYNTGIDIMISCYVKISATHYILYFIKGRFLSQSDIVISQSRHNNICIDVSHMASCMNHPFN